MSKQLSVEEYRALFKKIKAMSPEEREKWAKENNVPHDDDFAGFDSSAAENDCENRK